VYPAVLLTYFISVAVILLASLALIVHVLLPYNKTGRASVLYHFILVFLRVFLWSKYIIYNTCNYVFVSCKRKRKLEEMQTHLKLVMTAWNLEGKLEKGPSGACS